MNVQVFAFLAVCAMTQTNIVNAINPCATVKCPPGTTCRIRSVTCVREPCFPVAICQPKPIVKPGVCPRLKPIGGICIVKCKNDGDCPADLKCCGSCPRQCTKPATTNKPGSCPKSTIYAGPCVARCSNDADCPSNLKCCGSCPRECKRPVFIPKPGTCPKSTIYAGPCIARCSTDADCPSTLKCCGSCPRECKRPVLRPKPGRCPLFSKLSSCELAVRCTSDADCKGSLKCCRSSCGRVCTNSIYNKWSKYLP